MAGHTGTADLPLHEGHAPRWLFARMVLLAREIVLALADEFGTEGVLARLSDPRWFQALGSLLGFDWHSSGLTTTTCGAVKEALRAVGDEIGLYGAGGKGAASRRTPLEIAEAAPRLAVEPGPLADASRMAAKVDSAALQDGFQIYHHAFFFDRAGRWCVVQQGMNEKTGLARRYHWFSEAVADFVCEPHAGIVGPRSDLVLNLVAREADGLRRAIPEVAREPPERLVSELSRLQALTLPRRHALLVSDLDPQRLRTVFLSSYASEATDFAGLLRTRGGGGEGPAGPRPAGRASLRHPRLVPRSGPVRLCPRREGWDPLPGGPGDLRSNDRDPPPGSGTGAVGGTGRARHATAVGFG